ncbi:hypothetical protein HGRIS_006213 [Hohenbuehelia grisea]|uniref:BTB domain-containing protein n=1 Tax=Hohenbuehelia grisea TaxID=104357 RepID=A0ABR3K0H2_9AGAR
MYSNLPPYKQRGEPWFEDGNLILVTACDAIAFRVHRGVLARHSEIFNGMFELPQPTASTSESSLEMIEGCQVVKMYDLPAELSSLVKALYDGVSFSNQSIDDFFHLAGILRLSSKYFIAHLRTEAIHFLTETWAVTLGAHDMMVHKALETSAKATTALALSYPYVHPLHVLNLARETNVRSVVPSCIYFLSLYRLDDILSGDHPKLQVEHPSRPSSVLTLEDIRLYTLMFQRRIDINVEFFRQFCGKRNACAQCTNAKETCRRGFSKLTRHLSDSWNVRTSALHWMNQAVEYLETLNLVCYSCYAAFSRDVKALRESTWEELPSYIGLPSWAELIKADRDLPT